MAIYIDAEVAAIATRIKELYPTIKQYYTDIPDDFKRPSFFFERPRVLGEVFNNKKYKKMYNISIKIFDDDKNAVDSWELAREVADNILFNRHSVQMVDTDMNKINNFLRILDTETREITDNSTNLSLKWNSLYNYKVDVGTLMEEIKVTSTVKE